MERGYDRKMIKRQISRAQEDSTKDVLERKKEAQTSKPKLMFNITYYLVFRGFKFRRILQELHLLLAPDKEHAKVFSNVPDVEFRNGKTIKDYLIRAVLPKTNKSGRCEPCGKKTCLVCNSIKPTKTFRTEACRETFKTQSDPLNCTFLKYIVGA